MASKTTIKEGEEADGLEEEAVDEVAVVGVLHSQGMFCFSK